MKKFAIMGLTALLIATPLAACGTVTPNSGNTPSVAAPLPEIPEAEVPEVEMPALPEEPEPVPAKAEYIMVRTNGLNVRSGAGASYSSLGTVEKNVLLHFGGTEGGWYRTLYRGKTAYVSAQSSYTSLTDMEAGDERVEAVISEGLKRLGVPYVYGAGRYHDGKGNKLKNFTTSEFDCSSLMQDIFYQGAGVLLDVTTRTQVKQGVKVTKANLQRGDLMFFTNASRKNNTGIERVGHVALYLGDNYILHTASDYAKIEQISSTRWSYFIEGRRVL